MEVRAGSHQGSEVQTRRFGRVPFQAPVRLIRLSTGQVLELNAMNLSENGLFLETVIPFSVGEVFRLSFPTKPSGFEEVSAARVVWRRPYSSPRSAGQAPGVAISFLLMHPGDRQALARLVDDGGIIPPRVKTTPSRAPVAARIVPGFKEPPPEPRLRLDGPGSASEIMEVGPFGWLLVLALAMAALASLLLGLQPV